MAFSSAPGRTEATGSGDSAPPSGPGESDAGGAFRIRAIDGVALVPCALFWLAFIWRSRFAVLGRRQFTLFDDAMISMRYAQTLSRGHGLVWFEGAPRVEGYTNFLWTIVMSAFHAVGFDGSQTSLGVMVLCGGCIAGTALIGAGILRQLGVRSRWVPPIGALVIGSCYPLVYWSLRGMEVGLVTLLTVAACALALSLARTTETLSFRDARVLLLGALLVAGVLTRTDFVVVAGAVAIWLFVVLGARGRVIGVGLAGLVGLVIGLHTAFRVAYYGSALPNTYVLKMTGVSLAARLERGMTAGIDALLVGFVASLLLTGVACVVCATAGFRRGMALLIGVAAALVAYSVYVGGDAWEWMRIANRYLVPGLIAVLLSGIASADRIVSAWQAGRIRPAALALLIVLVAIGAFFGPLVVAGGVDDSRFWPSLLVVAMCACIAVVVARPRSRAAVGFVLLVLTTLAVAPAAGASLRPGLEWLSDDAALVKDDAAMVRLGYALRRVTRPNATMAVVWAGAPAYYSERRTLDIYGKSDEFIARLPSRGTKPGHNKRSYGYTVGRLRPDVVAQLVGDSPELAERLQGWGYVEVPAPVEVGGTWWVREGTPRVRWDLIQGVG